MAGECRALDTVRRVPEPDRAVVAAAGQRLAVLRKGQRNDPARWPLSVRTSSPAAGFQIFTNGRSRRWRESFRRVTGDRSRRIVVSDPRAREAIRRRTIDVYLSVFAGGGHATIRRIGDGGNGDRRTADSWSRFGALQNARRLSRGDVPHTKRLIGSPVNNVLPSRMKARARTRP